MSHPLLARRALRKPSQRVATGRRVSARIPLAWLPSGFLEQAPPALSRPPWQGTPSPAEIVPSSWDVIFETGEALQTTQSGFPLLRQLLTAFFHQFLSHLGRQDRFAVARLDLPGRIGIERIIPFRHLGLGSGKRCMSAIMIRRSHHRPWRDWHLVGPTRPRWFTSAARQQGDIKCNSVHCLSSLFNLALGKQLPQSVHTPLRANNG